MKSIEAIRAGLEYRWAVLADRLKVLGKDRYLISQPLSPDFAEQAVERENEEVLDRLDETTRNELRQVKRAISRIDKGRYGLCEDCCEPIELARLQAIPEATKCLACAEMPAIYPDHR